MNNKGQASIFIAIFIAILLGFAAFVIDIGLFTYKKGMFQNACDAAVLSGAQDLYSGTDTVRNSLLQYIWGNGLSPEKIEISFSDSNHIITVKAFDSVKFFFAPVLGIKQGDISVKASAIMAPVKKVFKGLRPFGIEKSSFSLNQQVILKVTAWGGGSSDIKALTLDSTGIAPYEAAILNGSDKTFEVGDSVAMEKNSINNTTVSAVRSLINMCSHSPRCTPESYRTDCPKIITVPVIDSLSDAGGDYVEIAGFARFFPTGAADYGEYVEITGEFIEDVDNGEPDTGQYDYGMRAVKLID
jgi:Predicted membrane protein